MGGREEGMEEVSCERCAGEDEGRAEEGGDGEEGEEEG
jgi:hypothetical protein